MVCCRERTYSFLVYRYYELYSKINEISALHSCFARNSSSLFSRSWRFSAVAPVLFATVQPAWCFVYSTLGRNQYNSVPAAILICWWLMVDVIVVFPIVWAQLGFLVKLVTLETSFMSVYYSNTAASEFPLRYSSPIPLRVNFHSGTRFPSANLLAVQRVVKGCHVSEKATLFPFYFYFTGLNHGVHQVECDMLSLSRKNLRSD